MAVASTVPSRMTTIPESSVSRSCRLMPSSRAGLIDLVQDGDGRHQEDAVQALVKADINVDLVQWDVLALLHDPGLDGLGLHMGLHMWLLPRCPHTM